MSGGPFGGPFGGSGGPADALRAAAESGDVEAAKAQLALSSMSKEVIDSVDSGYFGGTALSFAAEGGHDAIVEALLAAGASAGLADRSGYSPLHLAARHGHATCMRLLLQGGAPPDARDGQKQTPLHLCASKGQSDGATLLLDFGASVDAIGGEARTTALWRAVEQEHTALSLTLIDARADATLCDATHRETPLHLAARDGNATVVRALLNSNSQAVVNARDWMRSTPLHHASDASIAALLLRAGADPLSRGAGGLTPAEAAQERKKPAVAAECARFWVRSSSVSRSVFLSYLFVAAVHLTAFCMSQQTSITVGARQRLAWASLALHPRLAEHSPALLLAKRGFDLIAVIAKHLKLAAPPAVSTRAVKEHLALEAVSMALQSSPEGSAIAASGPLRSAVTSAEALAGIAGTKVVTQGREVLDEVDSVSVANAQVARLS